MSKNHYIANGQIKLGKKEVCTLIHRKNEKKMLHNRAAQFGISLTEDHIESLCLFIDLLVEWNSKINLTGTSDRSRIINELLLDSLVPVPYLPEKGKLVDLGSGAGFPALIIKILKPGLEVKLLESNGKKVSFLKYAIHSLHLKGITAINKRIELVTEETKTWGCNIVTSRAMASLETIIRLSETFLSPGGLIVGFLGKDGDKELKNIQEIFLKYNMQLQDSITYQLPEKESERTTVLIKK